MTDREQPHKHDANNAKTNHSVGCCHHDHSTSQSGINLELVCSLLAGLCLISGWSLSHWTIVSPEIAIAFYASAYLLTTWFMARETWAKVRAGRFDIDSLMLLAAGGAAYLGKWAEGALLLFLFSLGHALESYAMGRAKRAIEALADLTPETALVFREGKWLEVPVDELNVGERVTVKPNERVAADGFVVQGTSSINQAPVTGESVPVDKVPVANVEQAAKNPQQLASEHRVYAGTINGARAIEIQVTKTSADNTLSRVVQLVSQAQTRISPTQSFTHTIEKYFVPTVLIIDVLLLFAWTVIDEPISASIYRAMSLLVAASPCALAISTPSAILAGVARAARGGVLIKGGAPLESLGSIETIAFDKTGTLTEGRPRLTDVRPLIGIATERLLSVAVAAESLSDHPLAKAIVRDAKSMLGDTAPLNATEIEEVIGRGVKARVAGQSIAVGKESLFNSIPSNVQSLLEDLKPRGRTTMIVQYGDEFLGVLGVMDTPRVSAASAIEQLKQLGIKHMVMLSGDHQQVAQAIASSIGISEARGDLMPEDKVETVRLFSSQGGVAMVGDGVNDAPAMANATVGIAMGAAGSDVALETSDVALMGDDLSRLPFAVGLSRQTRAIITQNLWISLGMIAFLIPATMFGLSLGPAVVLHEGSTVVVVLNALRLLLYQLKSEE